MNGPTCCACGDGHCNAPAVTPSGSVQVTDVGKPVSPGFFQYVCQPGSMLRRNATVNAESGATLCTSLISVAFTGGCAPTCPANANTSNEASSRTTYFMFDKGSYSWSNFDLSRNNSPPLP